MARRPVFESCMLCGELPCVCIKAPKAKAAPKPRKAPAKPTPQVEEPPAPVAALSDDPPMPPTTRKAAVRAAMRAHVRGVEAPPAAPVPVLVSDPVMDDAIRALAPILHPIERRAYDAVLNAPSSIQSRAAAWREKIRGTA